MSRYKTKPKTDNWFADSFNTASLHLGILFQINACDVIKILNSCDVIVYINWIDLAVYLKCCDIKLLVTLSKSFLWRHRLHKLNWPSSLLRIIIIIPGCRCQASGCLSIVRGEPCCNEIINLKNFQITKKMNCISHFGPGTTISLQFQGERWKKVPFSLLGIIVRFLSRCFGFRS